uniref:NmrA-like domain-containing protein n=1 Tax=Chlamydomonas leiostraca TaxID=1034604 RepID=A0A7S0WZB3_9CHLO
MQAQKMQAQGQRVGAMKRMSAFGVARGQSRLRTVRCYADGTPVPKNSILVVGGTGTLGRQIVRRALDEGYSVRCIVRPRQNPADFLREWGATTVQADLLDPTSLPATLVGISAIIDCATARPEESTTAIDWKGKVALIQCAQAMGIQRYVFTSIYNCDKHPEVPLMNIKACTERYLAASGVPYTTLRLCGFHQAVIGNYAVPILEDKPVWGTTDETRISYLDTQDAARMTLAALRSDKAANRTLTLAGPKAWSTQEVIALCEQLSNSDAKVQTVPTVVLKGARGILRSLQWAKDAADRLAFAEVLSNNETWSAPMDETYELLGIEPSSVQSLDDYLKEYFNKILKKLKEVGATSDRTNFYV